LADVTDSGQALAQARVVALPGPEGGGVFLWGSFRTVSSTVARG
jgi:hypothetical protein